MSEPQWSEDGEHWWDGTQWITAAEARAQAERIAAVETHRPAYLPAIERANASPVAKRAVGAALLVVFGVGLATVLGHHSTPEAQRDHSDVVTATLESAAKAQQKHFGQAKRYTARLDQLNADGYTPKKGVTLTVVNATGKTFCLQATKGITTKYATPDGLTDKSCA